MKLMWCWRCKQVMPMLDEVEYQQINQLYFECMQSAQKYRNDSLMKSSLNELFSPLVQEYERITGYKDLHHNAIMHHRISQYGDPCRKCGKPLRTPQAKMCVACGENV
ncbi:hypothetical protein HZF08_16525 [Paenibacillus sp. CGMCC 1.16610]|uniref:Zinc ribbon domain-containing protein n=3 Tax=Paenibacillus TaxID=44249 RepID=A0ABW9UK90_9BACL|nr:hypothetical protein [Paenibacillus sp. CGMCC 1.16610]MVQ39578.1 hypothetical protein [Paenibacillus anseongense]